MIDAAGNRRNSDGAPGKCGWPDKDNRNCSGVSGVLLCDELRMVMGSTGVVDPERDIPGGDEDGRVCICGELEHAVHVSDSAGVPVNAMQHEGRGVLLLWGLDHHHGALRRLPAT